MTQIEILNNNIDEIQLAINTINETVNGIEQPTIDIKQFFMTNRQIMKKIIMVGGNMSGIPDTGAADIQIDEESAHMLVYGKLMIDEAGNLVDDEITFPECVHEKTKTKDSHPMKMWIKNKKLEVSIAFDQLKSKGPEIKNATIQLTNEVAASFITLASSPVILPSGAGMPVALSALQGILSALQAYQTKIIQILPLLEPLTFVAILIPLNVIDTVIGMINIFLSIINTALAAVAGILSIVDFLKNTLTSAKETMDAKVLKITKITANPAILLQGGTVKLSVAVENGSWQYEYLWTDENGNTISNEKDATVSYPNIYTCKVTDIKNNSTVSKTIEISNI